MSLDEMDIDNMTTIAELRTVVKLMRSDYSEALDTIWMLLASLLVFFMHAGFSMLEAGCVRHKNTQHILAKNLIVVTVGFLCWYFVGYAFALGVPEDPNKFGGHANFAMHGFKATPGEGVSNLFRVWFFQGAFCATAGTIVSGAMAERTMTRACAIFTIIMTSVIYPMIVYWGWSGNGFLSNDDGSIAGPAFSDFAGSGIVHLTGGVGALVGAIIVGPRKDRWDEHTLEQFEAHSIPFCVLGTFFLWFGWYGFNPGSTGAMHSQEDAFAASLVACNTTLAPCVSGLLVFMLRARVCYPKCHDVGGFCNGVLAGLVAITAGCASVQPWEAIIIGLFGGLIYQGASMLVRRLRIDDVVDAISVHGACGLWGILSIGFLGDPDVGGNGVLYGGDQLGVQLVAGLIIIAWVSVISAIVFLALQYAGWLRVSDEEQEVGADKAKHTPDTELDAHVTTFPVGLSFA